MQRRAFLLAGAGWTAANALAADDQRSLAIVDTHTHFYDPTRPQGVPWPGKGDKALYRPILPDEFKRLARPLGVVGTVVVEASPWVEDNGWLLDLAAKDPFLLGVVGRLDPAADTFDAHLRRFARNPLYRGIRIGHDDLKAGLEGKLVERCQRLIDHDLTLDVNGGPDLPADVARLAARLPKLRIVVNHAANLRIDGRPVPRGWRDGMRAAARHANVFCKVSALVEQTARTPPPRDVDYYRPVLDALWADFGADRLLFGSNWPVSATKAPLATVVGIARAYFADKGARAAVRFFHDNAPVAYRYRAR